MARREFGTIRGRWANSAEGRKRAEKARAAQAEATRKGKSYLPRYDYYTASYKHGGVSGVVEAVEYRAPYTFLTRGDARVWLDREEAIISAGEWTPPVERAEAERQAQESRTEAPTIASFGATYIEGRPSASTKARYRQLFDFYIRGLPVPSRKKRGKPKVWTERGLGDTLVAELTRRQVREWWQSLPVAERADSCHQAYALLRAIMNAAVEDEGIPVEINPVKIRGAGKASKERDNEPLPLPVLYAIADEMPSRYRLGVLLAGVLGLRSGEVRALQRQDVEDDVLHVQHSVNEQHWDDDPIGELKTERSNRRLVIPSALLPDVRRHLLLHTQLGPKGLLFWTDDGLPVRSPAWLKVFKKACQRVADATDDEKVKRLLTEDGGYVFHGTRVTGLTAIYRHSGGNLKAVMAVGGHTSSKTALRYQRAELDYQRALMEIQSQEIEEQGLGKAEGE